MQIVYLAVNNLVSHEHCYMYVKASSLETLFSIFKFKVEFKDNLLSFVPFQLIKMDYDEVINSLKKFLVETSTTADVWKFFKFIKSIKNGEYFSICIELFTEEAELKNYIEKYFKDIFETLEDMLFDKYHNELGIPKENTISKYYYLKSTLKYINKNNFIFNLNIKNRKCKYCDNIDDKYFHNYSHIIPESVGGHLIDKLECDKCNSWFNENIEQDFIEFLNIDRTIFGISGKNGIPKIENSSVKIENSPKFAKNTLVFQIKDPKITPYNLTSENFSFNKKINFNYLYKTLCKIALGVLDYKDMNIYTDTIEWIKDLKSTKKVPHIIIYRYGGTVNDIDKPYINIFIRKNDDYNLPHIFVELNCKFVSFHYILPFSKNDKNDFLEEGLVEKIYKDIFMFKHTEYTVYDCSNNEKVDVKFNINFNLT